LVPTESTSHIILTRKHISPTLPLIEFTQLSPTMAEQRKLHTPLRWTWYQGHTPVWPQEPDIAAVKSLARQHLQSEIDTTIEEDLLDVSFFAEGGFNKLYQITYHDHRPSYLLRVALPVDPYLKTESEVATIAFLRAQTSMPAPRIIAWQSNRNGELGFEWILMEKIQGVPMCDVWRKIPWERKLVLVEVLAGFIKEMQDQKFDSIGALYFESALENIGGKRINAMAHDSSTDVVAADEKPDISDQKQDSDTQESLVSTGFESLQLHGSSSEDTNRLKPVLESIANTPQAKPTLAGHIGKDDFAIGQLLDGLFIIRGRLYISGDRGPYSNPIQWLSALIHMELEWIKKYQTEGDDEYDSDLAEESPAMTSLCHEYLKILPALFAEEQNGLSCMLDHSDLNPANILVNPETFDITGIVDWEMVNVVPHWKAEDHPVFMQDIEPFAEEEPPIPSYDDEEDCAVYARDRWDNRLLRRHWDDTMESLRSVAKNDVHALEDAVKSNLKRENLQQIQNLSDMWNRAQRWLKEYKSSKDSLDNEQESEARDEACGEEQEKISA